MKTMLSLALFCVALHLQGQHDHKAGEAAPADTLKKSISKDVHAQLGETHMMIKYHAPAVRGLMIWGGLVPYGEVWVTGAHSATTWEFNKDIVIGNQAIPAGKYAIFTIPGTEGWTIIVNKNWKQHLADDYDEKDDVLRIEVKASQGPHKERLQYRIEPREGGGEVQIAWEKVSVALPFKLTR